MFPGGRELEELDIMFLEKFHEGFSSGIEKTSLKIFFL